MLRHLFTLAAALSFLMVFPTAALWWRSYAWSDHYLERWVDPDKRILHHQGFRSGRGRISYNWQTEAFPVDGEVERLYASIVNKRGWRLLSRAGRKGFDERGLLRTIERGLLRKMGFDAYSVKDRPTRVSRLIAMGYVRVPHWSLVTVFSVLPALRIHVWLRSRRRRRARHLTNLCSACGYDLRASDEKCPECGALIPARDAPIAGTVRMGSVGSEGNERYTPRPTHGRPPEGGR